MTTAPYEEPTAGPSVETPVGFPTDADMAALRTEGTPEAPPALPSGMSQEVATLLQQLAQYERAELESVVNQRLDGFMKDVGALLDDRLVELHEPHGVFRNGIIFGAAMVVIALLALLALGLLFLFGLSLVSPAR